MTKNKFEAVIFDLDGVITKTASVHAKAWKKMFDQYLKYREKEFGESFKEFTHSKDYLPYVDGKPRYKGVQSFLASRGIKLPYGTPDDPPGKETVCGLGNRKNELFGQVIKEEGAEVFDSTVELINELKRQGIKLGVASSSKNCKLILETTDLLHLFDTRVDGVVSAELGLTGKPEPDIFTQACDNLNASYHRSVVVEDAVSGVQAGKNGHFGLVIGIAREDNHHDLRINGADIVISDMREITVDDINNWFEFGLEQDKWSLNYFDFDEECEITREALCTVGNGYFATRGAFEEFMVKENPIHYPGTYIHGIYNKVKSEIAGRTVRNEDFVNCPNWLLTTFKIEDDPWIHENWDIVECKRLLDFRSGVLSRSLIVKDRVGRKTKIKSKRFISMKDAHLGALSYTVIPLNYSGTITMKSGLDGDIINDGVARYRDLNQKHLRPLHQTGEIDTENNQITHNLIVETTTSNIKIAESAKYSYSLDRETLHVDKLKPDIIKKKGQVYSTIQVKVPKNSELNIKKIVSIYTSQNFDVPNESELIERLQKTLKNTYKLSYSNSHKEWSYLWDQVDIKLIGNRFVQKLLRFNSYHLLVTASPNTTSLDAGIPARGLHGEAYRGKIFWDSLYILPFYLTSFPRIAKTAIMYRYRRLEQAKAYAREYGYQGAMFPWQSGKSGEEETQKLHLNPKSGEWGPDNSRKQRHVSLAIAYNVWNYYKQTDDLTFMAKYGSYLMFEVCRFWADKAEFNPETNRYSIKGVMGPDEFHERYPPDSNEAGLDDNTYTNLMVVWLFDKAQELFHLLKEKNQTVAIQELQLNPPEIEEWIDIKDNINIILSSEGVLAQFDGYFSLEEIDWDYYANKYENIQRMDRILKAEGKNPNKYKVAKQADALMIFYTLDPLQVKEYLNNLGYDIPEGFLQKNYEYYIKRTSHGSTLSKLVHAYLQQYLAQTSLESYNLYLDALQSDYIDIQGGTTGEGIHTGVMAGTVTMAIKSYAGVTLQQSNTEKYLAINPNLPDDWKKISFKLKLDNNTYHFKITSDTILLKIIGLERKETKIKIYDDLVILQIATTPDAEWYTFSNKTLGGKTI